MADPDNRKMAQCRQTKLQKQLQRKVRRKIKFRRESSHNIFFWMGLFGLVGWSVSIPILIGIALGTWIDHRWPGDASWTLMLLLAGLVLGCWNAWHWIQQEIHND